MTVRVSASDAYASVARGDALTSAIGLSISSPLPTIQSNAFFNTPGTPCAYSGLEISTASARAIRRRNARTRRRSADFPRSRSSSRASKLACERTEDGVGQRVQIRHRHIADDEQRLLASAKGHDVHAVDAHRAGGVAIVGRCDHQRHG